MICVPAVMLTGVEVVFAMPAPAHPKPFGDCVTTRAGSVATGEVLAPLTAARFAAPPPSVIAFGNTQLLLASLISATFCVVPEASLTVKGLGQAAWAAESPIMATAIAAAEIQRFAFTPLAPVCYLRIGIATALQPVATE